MITLSPASTRPIRLSVPAKRGIVVEKVNANLPAPAIRLLSGPPGTVPGPPVDPETLGDGLTMIADEIRIDIDSLTHAI